MDHRDVIEIRYDYSAGTTARIPNVFQDRTLIRCGLRKNFPRLTGDQELNIRVKSS